MVFSLFVTLRYLTSISKIARICTLKTCGRQSLCHVLEARRGPVRNVSLLLPPGSDWLEEAHGATAEEKIRSDIQEMGET